MGVLQMTLDSSSTVCTQPAFEQSLYLDKKKQTCAITPLSSSKYGVFMLFKHLGARKHISQEAVMWYMDLLARLLPTFTQHERPETENQSSIDCEVSMACLGWFHSLWIPPTCTHTHTHASVSSVAS